MDQTSDNPVTNILEAGISETDLKSAIERSGYPLQTVIGNALRSEFRVQDEWSYIDRDTHDLRTIDILAQKPLYPYDNSNPRIRPSVNLLIECKQSELPFIFFLTPEKPFVPQFPMIAGLGHDSFQITSDDDPSSWEFDAIRILGLEEHRFITNPPYCYTLSKCTRAGKNIELSGNETYNSLVLPIIKSLHHFKVLETPPTTAMYYDAHLTLGIAILDAPMIGVHVLEKSNQLTLLPWVRVVRLESSEEASWWTKSNFSVVDFLHKDFFQTYITQHAVPYANDFAALAIKHQQILASGKAFAAGMEKNSWDDIEARLQPRAIQSEVIRTRLIFRNISNFLFKRKSTKDETLDS